MYRLNIILLTVLLPNVHGCTGKPSPKESEQPAASEGTTSARLTPQKESQRPQDTIHPAPASDAGQVVEQGAEVCADCHPGIVENFQKTGMGNSLYRPNDRPRIESFDPKKATINHPKSGLTYRAYVDEKGRWWQEETLPGTDYSRRVEAKYVIGSGNHTRSYLGEVDGELVELPLTWYSARAIWDMSPGYEIENHFRFDRPAKPICLFCHNNLTPADPKRAASYLTDLEEGISCNRCHGDGTAHVKARSEGVTPKGGTPDPTILNPKHLTPNRQLQICQQCHLSGVARVLKPGKTWDEYDPRTPLNDYMSVYTYASDDGAEFSITSHGYRLSLSACFKSSGNALTCTQCHDPHRRDKVKETQGACLNCHKMDDCGDKHRAGSGQACASCHMKRGDTSDIPHVSFTDHFIRIRPEKTQPKNTKQNTKLIDAFATFGSKETPELTQARLGIAHARIWRLDGKAEHRPIARELLRSALNALPTHGEAWQELALILKSERKFQEAAMAFAQAAQTSGGHHNYRTDEADNLEQLGQIAAAAEVLTQTVEADPKDRVAWGNLANALLKLGRLDDAERAYERADVLAPSVALTASNRGYLLLQRGRLDEAERWFKEALRRDGSKGMMYANMGTLALARRDPKTAREFYLKSIERNPKFAVGYWMLARLDAQAGRIDEARTHLTTMIKVAPEDLRGYLDLAELHRQNGDLRQASITVLKAQKLFPSHPAVLNMLRRLKSP